VIDDDTALQNIAANVTRMMADRGISQTALAEMVGGKQPTISRICHGTNMPSASVLRRIAEALETSMEILIDSPPKPLEKTRKVG